MGKTGTFHSCEMILRQYANRNENSIGEKPIKSQSRGVNMNFDMKPLRVVLADDHTLVLEAFSNLISHEVDVVGTASDGRELIKVVKETNPDIVVSDITMPVLNGLDAASKLLKTNPDLKIIFSHRKR